MGRDDSGSKGKKLFLIWILLSLIFWFWTVPYVALGVSISGLSTLLAWFFRKPISFILGGASKWKFILIGSLGALWIEFEFWVLFKVSGVNIVAHPNLLIDFAFTMPWYIVMVTILWKVQNKYNYSLFSVFILGGIYSFFAEGFVKFILGAIPLNQILLFALTFPGNALSYSFIILPASFLLKNEVQGKPGRFKYIYGLLPILGLIILIPVIVFFTIFPVN